MTREARLMEHIHALAETIGPRPSASDAESRAAQYVAEQLRALGVEPVREQQFASSMPVGRTSFMLTTLMALGLVAGRGSRIAKLLGGITALSSVYALYRLLQGAPLPLTDIFQPQQSQNLIAHLPPAKRSRQFLFLTANLDSDRPRVTHVQGLPFLRRAAGTGLIGLSGLAGLGMLADVLIGRRQSNGAQTAAAFLSVMSSALLGYDELQPPAAGANGNASGVAVLLGLAEALLEKPLEHTEVVLLFTGAQEASASGINAYLRQFAPPRSDTWWIDVEMVGAGELAYVAEGGSSIFTSYRPAPRITALANQIVQQHPELRVTPQTLDLMGGALPLVNAGYEAIAVVGYTEQGIPGSPTRLPDTAERVDAEVMARAQTYIGALMRAIDEYDR
ncbi:MAG TPA: M28 family peptidase [Candidatus Limnocylindrales bacterium]|nr:M28 family peptidase [Candidatus Limnocylindrales bacterium]